MTSDQPRYENPAPPTDSGSGAAVRPSSPILREQRAVVALRLVALDRGRGQLAGRELARGRLEEPLLLGQPAGHPRSRPAARSARG